MAYSSRSLYRSQLPLEDIMRALLDSQFLEVSSDADNAEASVILKSWFYRL